MFPGDDDAAVGRAVVHDDDLAGDAVLPHGREGLTDADRQGAFFVEARMTTDNFQSPSAISGPSAGRSQDCGHSAASEMGMCGLTMGRGRGEVKGGSKALEWRLYCGSNGCLGGDIEMSTIVKADANGAVTLPAELCRAAGVEPVDSGGRYSERPDHHHATGAERGRTDRRHGPVAAAGFLRRFSRTIPRPNTTTTFTARRNGRIDHPGWEASSPTRSIGLLWLGSGTPGMLGRSQLVRR